MNAPPVPASAPPLRLRVQRWGLIAFLLAVATLDWYLAIQRYAEGRLSGAFFFAAVALFAIVAAQHRLHEIVGAPPPPGGAQA